MINLKTEEFVLEMTTLQSLQQLIQWVGDFVLYLLASLPNQVRPRVLGTCQEYANIHGWYCGALARVHRATCPCQHRHWGGGTADIENGSAHAHLGLVTSTVPGGFGDTPLEALQRCQVILHHPQQQVP